MILNVKPKSPRFGPIFSSVLVLIAATISGCGQRGPLTLPVRPTDLPAATPSATPPATAADTAPK